MANALIIFHGGSGQIWMEKLKESDRGSEGWKKWKR